MNERESLKKKLGPLVDSMESRIDKFFIKRQKADLWQINSLYVSILNAIRDYYDASAVVLVFVDDDLDFERIFNVGYKEDFSWRERVSFGDGALSRSIHSRNVDLIRNVIIDGKYVAICPETKAQISIPLTNTVGQTFGALAIELDYTITDDYNDGDFVRLIRPLSRIFSHVDSMLATLQMQSVLSLVADIPISQGSFDDIIKSIFDAIEIITADGELALLYRVGGSLVVTNTRHLDESPERLQIGAARGQGYTAWSAHTGKSHYCKDAENREKYPYYRNVDNMTKSQYTIPLVLRNEVVGVLNIGARIPFAFSFNQRHLLDVIGRHATYAIFYWRLYRDIALISHEAFGRLGSVSYLREFLLSTVEPSKQQIASQMMDSVTDATKLVETASYPFLSMSEKVGAIIPAVYTILDQRGQDLIQIKVCSDSASFLSHGIQEFHLKDFINTVLDWITLNIEDRNSVLEMEILEEAYEGIKYIVFRWQVSVKLSALEGLLIENLDDLVSIRNDGPRSQRIALSRLPLWKADRILANYGGYLDIDGCHTTNNEVIMRGTIRQ